MAALNIDAAVDAQHVKTSGKKQKTNNKPLLDNDQGTTRLVQGTISGNERETEEAVLTVLKRHGYSDINFQGSKDIRVQSLLKSKSGDNKGRGKPEFTIKLNGIASDLLIVECKKNKTQHASPFSCAKDVFTAADIQANMKNAAQYAEDGVLHYMASVLGEYNVIGVAISGKDEATWTLTTFMSMSDGTIKRTFHQTIQPATEYISLFKKDAYRLHDGLVQRNIQRELPILHNELRDKMTLSESEKPLLISACLIALQDDAFRNGFRSKTSHQSLADFTYDTVRDRLTNTLGIPQTKVIIMMGNLLFIKNNSNVVTHLKYILDKVSYLFDHFIFSDSSYDVIGNFYNEFLKYTGGDKQGLGIVLTPKHIADLFCELAEIHVNSVILDTCTGTGAFLIAAMKHMIDLAKGDAAKITSIKANQLIGVEQNTHMFTLGCANMILRNDGKSNMFQGSCFAEGIKNSIKTLNPTACLINPPYSKKDQGESELAFIKNALDLLAPGGKLVAIVPISCAIEMSAIKIEQRRQILLGHTLDAVFSMPDDLFYPVGTVTCIMVFTAHKPHGKIVHATVDGKVVPVVQGTKPTFFGFWKDDGFVKDKIAGRHDKNGQWERIKGEWLAQYRMGTVINGRSAKETVHERMEWCCEAYMDIDYETLTADDFEETVRKYLAYQVMTKGVL